jgi:hypothetical protein
MRFLTRILRGADLSIDLDELACGALKRDFDSLVD